MKLNKTTIFFNCFPRDPAQETVDFEIDDISRGFI